MKKGPKFTWKFFRVYFIALAAVITAAMLTVYVASVEHTENNAHNSAFQLAQKTVRQADMYIGELDFLAEQVKRQSDLLNVFYKLESDTNSENYFDRDILNNLEISSNLKNLLAGREGNCDIFVYNDSADVVSSREYDRNRKKSKQSVRRYTDNMKKLIQSEGNVVIFPDSDMWTNNKKAYITLAKVLQNDYSDDVCGIIEIRCDVDDFIEKITSDMGEGYTVSICDRTTGHKTTPIPDDRDKKTRTITAPMNSVNWEIEIEYHDPITFRFKVHLILIMLALYVILLLILFRIGNLVSNRISEPLVRLTEYVHKINAPHTQVTLVDDEAIDEIQELEKSFASMLERVDYLTRQEKKAYSLALQAQMNPHFLYNTLAVIGYAGEEGGCDNVAQMCVNLSDMLRYVTQYETVTVSLKEEIEHTENYLSFMKLRYEDYFSYEIDVDEKLLNIPVPKLCIQPLAENCFKHGFEDKNPPWNIHIKIRGLPQIWTLEISDNGVGMTEERIAEISKQIDDMIRNKTYDTTVGLGLANTIIRLKMTHNENLTYSITNENGMKLKIILGKGNMK